MGAKQSLWRNFLQQMLIQSLCRFYMTIELAICCYTFIYQALIKHGKETQRQRQTTKEGEEETWLNLLNFYSSRRRQLMPPHQTMCNGNSQRATCDLPLATCHLQLKGKITKNEKWVAKIKLSASVGKLLEA